MIACVIFRDTSGIKLTCSGANFIHSEVSQPAWCSKVWLRYSIPQAIDEKTSSWNRRYFFYYQLPAAWVVHRKQWAKGKKLSSARLSLSLLRTAVTLKNCRFPLASGKVGTKRCPSLSSSFSKTLFTLSQEGHSRYFCGPSVSPLSRSCW